MQLALAVLGDEPANDRRRHPKSSVSTILF
jgi:hypothetical protein